MVDRFLYKKIRSLINENPEYIRSDWYHYACPKCGGRNNHKYPPFAINIMNGGFKCLRCGISGSIKINKVNNIVPIKNKVKLDIRYSDHKEYKLDTEIELYMLNRGIKKSREWGYGRGQFLSSVVFVFRNEYDEVIKLQARKITEKQYVGSGLDIIDMSQYDGERIENLILVEGAMDMLRIRQYTQFKCSCLYGSSPSKELLQSIKHYHDVKMIKNVLILLDAEEKAQQNANEINIALNLIYNIPSKIIKWDKLDGSDPADCDLDRLISIVKETIYE